MDVPRHVEWSCEGANWTRIQRLWTEMQEEFIGPAAFLIVCEVHPSLSLPFPPSLSTRVRRLASSSRYSSHWPGWPPLEAGAGRPSTAPSPPSPTATTSRSTRSRPSRNSSPPRSQSPLAPSHAARERDGEAGGVEGSQAEQANAVGRPSRGSPPRPRRPPASRPPPQSHRAVSTGTPAVHRSHRGNEVHWSPKW